jgi:hypothetical protein
MDYRHIGKGILGWETVEDYRCKPMPRARVGDGVASMEMRDKLPKPCTPHSNVSEGRETEDKKHPCKPLYISVSAAVVCSQWQRQTRLCCRNARQIPGHGPEIPMGLYSWALESLDSGHLILSCLFVDRAYTDSRGIRISDPQKGVFTFIASLVCRYRQPVSPVILRTARLPASSSCGRFLLLTRPDSPFPRTERRGSGIHRLSNDSPRCGGYHEIESSRNCQGIIRWFGY